MHEYLISMIAVGVVIWLPLYLWRRDLRKPMVWSGLFYIATVTAWFITIRIPSALIPIAASRTLTPGYWEPKTLFNVGTITKGLAIEDIIFMFFIGGIATVLYEYCFHRRIAVQRGNHPHHYRALVFALFVALLFLLFFPLNVMYTLIAFSFAGAMIIWIEREDLIWHSILGGVLLFAIYTFLFYTLNIFFPDFVMRAYHLNNVSGVLIAGIPLEELLYAFGFGMFWSPIYEYEHGARNKTISA